jgi:carboxyl-terminal processing protease
MIKMTIHKFIQSIALTIVSLSFIMASCEEELVGNEKANTPVNNFDYFWKTFDAKYGLFEVKNIDWNEVYKTYRPRVSDSTKDEELYKVFSEMIVLLNDNHINLYPTNGSLPVFPGGVIRYKNGKLTILKVQEDYDVEVVKKYLSGFQQVTGNLAYGILPDNIGYINFKGTDKLKEVEKQMALILEGLKNTKGLVMDIRGNYGGNDAVSQYIAGCFANTKKLYMTTRKRSGPQHSDFTDAVEWYVEPRNSFQYTKPIVVLTSRFSQSTAETFALAMKELDHVTLVGDTTAGSYSDNPNTEMYNGWMFSFSVGDFRAADGKSYEGIGTAPDIWIRNSKEETLSGKDRTLEKAMELLAK